MSRAAAAALLLLAAGCASIQQPYLGNLGAGDARLRQCAGWFKDLDSAVARAGVGDVEASRVAGFPYLRTDRFTAAIGSKAVNTARDRQAWIARMRALDADGRRIEVANLPDAEIARLGAGDRQQVIARTGECAVRMADADLPEATVTTLLEQRAEVEDDYSLFKRTLGLYPVTRVPFYAGVKGWHDEATATFAAARRGEPAQAPLVRYVPPRADVYTRAEVAELLRRAADEPLGIPTLSEVQRERLFGTYAPVLEVETTGDFDRIGRVFWGTGPAPQVDAAQPTVYRKIAYTRVGDRTLVQLVYVAWMSERPKDNAIDLLGGRLDGIVWRVTLAPDGEPVLYDSIHPCGCFHMFFPTPRVEPVPAPRRGMEWAFSPAPLPAITEGSRIVVSAQTRTHYLRNVWPGEAVGGTEYRFADYRELRSLPLPGSGSRSIFAPDALVPGTERAERFFFWPMGIDSAGAMRQWGSHATAFVGRRHFDDADLIDRRFQLLR